MEQRFAFDKMADVYKAARPDYPEALIEDVISFADLKDNDKILEVGCGTGQATKSFALSRMAPSVSAAAAAPAGGRLLLGQLCGAIRIACNSRRNRHRPK